MMRTLGLERARFAMTMMVTCYTITRRVFLEKQANGTSKNILRGQIAASLLNAKLAKPAHPSPIYLIFDMHWGFAAGFPALRPLVTVFRGARRVATCSRTWDGRCVHTIALEGRGLGRGRG